MHLFKCFFTFQLFHWFFFVQIAKSIMKAPITIDKESPIYDAIMAMREKKISRLVLIEQKKPIGIVTEKDMGFFLLQDKTDRDIDEIHVAEVTKKLVSVSETTKVGDCARMMLEKDFSSLGVNSNSTIIGIITKTDFCPHMYQHNILSDQSW